MPHRSRRPQARANKQGQKDRPPFSACDLTGKGECVAEVIARDLQTRQPKPQQGKDIGKQQHHAQRYNGNDDDARDAPEKKHRRKHKSRRYERPQLVDGERNHQKDKRGQKIIVDALQEPLERTGTDAHMFLYESEQERRKDRHKHKADRRNIPATAVDERKTVENEREGKFRIGGNDLVHDRFQAGNVQRKRKKIRRDQRKGKDEYEVFEHIFERVSDIFQFRPLPPAKADE